MSSPPNNSGAKWWNFMKLGTNIVPLESTPLLHFLIPNISTNNTAAKRTSEAEVTLASLDAES
jgi:hypothetical protein